MKHNSPAHFKLAVVTLALALILPAPLLHAQARHRHRRGQLRVVTSLTTYADIARQIADGLVEITSLAEGPEDPHFVQPKPSLALTLRRADLLVTTGLDLEMWMPAVIDKANNPRVASGSPGFIAVSTGIRLADVPETVSRSEGDSHIYGCPHIWNEPANGIIIGENILTGLKRIDPENSALYEEHFAAWKERVVRTYVGDELVDLLGTDLIFDLDRDGELWTFISGQSYQGRPLTDRIGGWLAETAPFRGREMVCYHKAWSYFARAFGIPCAEFIEPKPGIPPTPRHVARVISLMQSRNIKVLLSATHFPREQVELVARRTGATAVIVPASVLPGTPGVETFIELMDHWVKEVTAALAETGT